MKFVQFFIVEHKVDSAHIKLKLCLIRWTYLKRLNDFGSYRNGWENSFVENNKHIETPNVCRTIYKHLAFNTCATLSIYMYIFLYMLIYLLYKSYFCMVIWIWCLNKISEYYTKEEAQHRMLFFCTAKPKRMGKVNFGLYSVHTRVYMGYEIWVFGLL